MQKKVDSYSVFKSQVAKYKNVSLIPVSEVFNPCPHNTGSISLDLQLHTPLPEGNQHEIYGMPGTGKTTIGLSILGYAQTRLGKHVAYMNEEGTINKSLIDTINTIDPDMKDEFGNPTFHVINTETAEQSLEIVKLFCQQPKTVVLVDSVDSMVPEKVVDSDFGDQHIGRLGKLMSRVCRDFAKLLARTQSTIIWLNQVRSNPGIQYGDDKVTPGGWALKFYCNQRLYLKKPAAANKIENEEGRVVGQKVPFEIVKNKCASAFVKGEIPIRFGYGIWESLDIANIAEKLGVLPLPPKGGRVVPPEFFAELDPPFTCDGTTTIFHKKLLEFLDNSPDALKLVSQKVKEILHGSET